MGDHRLGTDGEIQEDGWQYRRPRVCWMRRSSDRTLPSAELTASGAQIGAPIVYEAQSQLTWMTGTEYSLDAYTTAQRAQP